MRDDTGLSQSLSATMSEEKWQTIAARLHGRPFLHSEGMGASIAMPATVAPWLLAQSRELAERFNRFYRAVVDSAALANEPARQIGAPYEAIAEAEADRPPLPLSRLDCVLDATGTLRVIELNPVGVGTLHLRALSYLARSLVRNGERALAERVDQFRVQKMASLRRFIDATLASPVANPTVGLLLLPGVHRGTKHVWAHELREAGMRVVIGRPDEVRIADGSAHVGNVRVDALWVDWFLYLGYQQLRYEQTRFASKVGDYSSGSRVASALVTLPDFARALHDRTFTMISPMRAYRALSKALLAWIDAPQLSIPTEDRAWLRAHVCETFDHHARRAGVTSGESRMSMDRARHDRDELVLKPCRFGGSHGVLIGRDTADDAWAQKLAAIWTDPEWVLQTFVAPGSDANGAQLSYGVFNYDGAFGGMLIRAAPETIVSARTASLIAGLL